MEFSLAAKFSINFVTKHWLLEKYQNEDLGNAKKKIYAETIGIARKAINIAIEKDDLNVLKFLKTYILQNNCSLVENTTNASASGHKTSILEEHPKPNVIVESGCSHKKELHDYDNMEEKENESEWVGSSSSESDVEMDTDK
ncbi:hypothetical protein F8M41_012958 [Gigaspora margarita]|uniref:Uncharacterized protein n=1 Tax=Gigaspora margarita TaxID=4874 RepID=A0A8H4EP85_GIGMA|nr:hypothetical protein F8M41_012958 [Gigaspora margarita]